MCQEIYETLFTFVYFDIFVYNIDLDRNMKYKTVIQRVFVHITMNSQLNGIINTFHCLDFKSTIQLFNKDCYNY